MKIEENNKKLFSKQTTLMDVIGKKNDVNPY
jgi:hypothetical protein